MALKRLFALIICILLSLSFTGCAVVDLDVRRQFLMAAAERTTVTLKTVITERQLFSQVSRAKATRMLFLLHMIIQKEST